MRFRFPYTRHGGGGAPRLLPDRQSTGGAPFFFNPGLLWIAACLSVALPSRGAPFQVIASGSTQYVFAGERRPIEVAFHNAAEKAAKLEVTTAIYQTTSATAVPMDGPRGWKALEILPGQTILETNFLTFPAVKQATEFLVQWLGDSNQVLGHTDVMVYPASLLEALGPLCKKKPAGIYDPQNKIKPLLVNAGISFEDLETLGVKNYTGTLAIIRPFSEKGTAPDHLAAEITAIAYNGCAVVWIKSECVHSAALEPDIFTVRVGSGAVAVVRARAVANLAEFPLAQLNLARAAELAVKPELLSLNEHEP